MNMFILAGTTTSAADKTTCDDLASIMGIIGMILKIIQWIVPVILILLGTIDLVKAVSQGKEEEIKKGQKTLITRAIAAVLVFFIPMLVSTIMGLVGSNTWKTCWSAHKDDGISLDSEVSPK